MKYEYLIFDMDDTLIDNKENVRYAFKKMLEYLNKEYSDELFDDWYYFDIQYWDDYHNGLIDVPEEFKSPQEMYVKYVQSLRYVKFFNNGLNIYESFKVNDLFLNSLKEKVVPVDGALDILREFSEHYEIIIATNGPRQAIYTKIEKIGCKDYVNYVFAADMTKNTATKPNKLYFMELMEYIHCQDEKKLLIIGDSLKNDILGAMNIGCDSCWFDRGVEKLSSDFKPTYIIKNLNELKDILK